MKKVLILGSTGSIGTQALDVVGRSGELQVVGLAAGSGWELTIEPAREHGMPTIALADESAAERARDSWSGRVLSGEEGVRELIAGSGADLVLNGIVGAAGLASTVVALTAGIDVALANKESLVVGGELVTALAEATGARLLPVDSEHSALHQLIASEQPGTVTKLVLTASGGPFRGREDLVGVSIDDALAHPTWKMGGRITIDSATLMNKGFEAIEAHHLFAVPYSRIDVVVHPQSLVHSLIQLNDGSSLAHLGYPDMRVPISYALHYPERADVDVPQLDLAAVGSLSFEAPDPGTFACLRLALEAGEAGGTAPCVLNAADEVAVAAFLDGRIPFTGIATVIERVLEEMPAQPVTHFDDLFATDAEARRRSEDQGSGVGSSMNWFFIFAGFCLLIMLHEAGHFLAAKATGMRVERFFLFFGPTIWSFKRGETEYGVKAIPLGGYVKITGMNPEEEIPPEVEHRAYYRQPVWKRIVVIGAGPAVNIALAFVILYFVAFSFPELNNEVGSVEARSPAAAAALRPGDRLVSVDGKRFVGASQENRVTWFGHTIAAHKCAAAKPTKGCRATTPVRLGVERSGRLRMLTVYPVYDPSVGHTRVGISYGTEPAASTVGGAVSFAGNKMWMVASGTVHVFAHIFEAEQRKQISGIVGTSDVANQVIDVGLTPALLLLALVSLSLGLVNLLPILPLDGGHIFWSLVEKLRGEPVSLRVMERASIVGFALVAMLFFIGLGNDIGRIGGEGFNVR